MFSKIILFNVPLRFKESTNLKIKKAVIVDKEGRYMCTKNVEHIPKS